MSDTVAARATSADGGTGARAMANRQRLLAVATAELSRNPTASMEDIAAAAGVVRRTVYSHFPNRDALIDGLLDQAAEDINTTLATVPTDAPPALDVALVTIALWEVGDRYRLLHALTETNLKPRIVERLVPVRRHGTKVLKTGQREGIFSSHLPPDVLAGALEALVLSLLDARNDDLWHEPEPGTAAAQACLITAGVPVKRAETIARKAARLRCA